MKTIHKQTPPHRFTQYAQSAGATYAGMPSDIKELLRRALVDEQGGICAFCMGRIENDCHSVRIAHCQSQSPNRVSLPNLALAYTNLVASCTGGEGTADEHCDKSQGANNLLINPADTSHDWDNIFRYTQQGRIECDDSQWQQELDDVLRLNCDTVTRWRRAAWDGIVRQMISRNTGAWSEASIRQQIQNHLARQVGKFQPFCMIIVYLLRKRLGEV